MRKDFERPHRRHRDSVRGNHLPWGLPDHSPIPWGCQSHRPHHFPHRHHPWLQQRDRPVAAPAYDHRFDHPDRLRDQRPRDHRPRDHRPSARPSGLHRLPLNSWLQVSSLWAEQPHRYLPFRLQLHHRTLTTSETRHRPASKQTTDALLTSIRKVSG